MPPIVQVISIVHVVDVDIVGPVPNRRPGFRAGINHTEPKATELKTRRTFDHHHGDIVDTKPVSPAEMRAEPIFRNAVPSIAAAFVPRAMLTLPIMCALSLPDILPFIARPGL